MGTKLEVYCGNCKEHILEADTDTLGLPLTGAMFKVRPDREWYLYFDGECMHQNLTCPQCGWPFHVEQSLLVRKSVRQGHGLQITEKDMIQRGVTFEGASLLVTGKPKKIIKMFAPPPPEPEPEPVAVTSEAPTEPKPKKRRGFFKDTRSY